ncbi:phosphate/phosphite/phosphonate ABC transporter substrate-binding protein [Enterobacter chuandaensis]|uniref:PhnD/SsuA/transferrin family substrate-binding protein n=1 Tax=Enterobacter chuandaensis TaxID=2497875 RepID=A0AA96MA42_9ENTR|nr:PhnD/SsuA/transferrin family substrate-binding protein [Enterobacter chuandaensis]MCW4782112.1 PhnD/SsuA/transferrin family substrate-binding protein [Enterobacter chuandaensis]MDA4757567.1 PhnD/SsuA/transferrin family substrate-binding protein [Enterobacter chuandaensis]OQD48481.1 phosphate ABC transporter substrate-binding protein [Enterobacter cancerogenus]WNS40076.1 PhnD/SsuA/transferrin family substrate-binding protein [Enterobacter chuandaensis]
MSNLLAFPMYAVDRADTRALWLAVQHLLAVRGVSVDGAPGWPESDLLTHWQQPALILSQTCGYPLVTQLPEVQVVGCFHYTAAGCEGSQYRSFLVAREADRHLTLADFRGRRAVCNSADSQSGFNALRKKVARLASDGPFFSQTPFSGSHRQSLIDVKRGAGDIAAIDCVTWALLQRHEPERLAGLAVIDRTPLTPGLPLITSHNTSPETLNAIRDALCVLVSSPEYREVCDAVLIGGFSVVTRQAYASLLA